MASICVIVVFGNSESGGSVGDAGIGLADAAGADAMPQQAGGEAVTGPLNRKG